MSTLRPTLWRVMWFLLLALPVQAADESAPLPKHLRASIGGFIGASYMLELNGDALTYTYTSFESGRRNQKQARITPTPTQWRAFHRTLNELNLWQWQAEYPNPGVTDGTQWSLDIAYADHAIESHGDNNYPDASGKPTGDSNPTNVFHRYLAAMSKLIGDRNFE